MLIPKLDKYTLKDYKYPYLNERKLNNIIISKTESHIKNNNIPMSSWIIS